MFTPDSPGGHDAMCPAADVAVQSAAFDHGYMQAAVVVHVAVRPRCPRRVALEHGPVELMRRRCCHACPVPGGSLHVGTLVDQQAVAETFSGYSAPDGTGLCETLGPSAESGL